MSRRTRAKQRRRQARRRSSRNLVNKWTLSGLALVLLGLVVVLIATRSSPATPTSSSTANQQDIPFPEVPRTPLADVKAKFDAGTVLIVDTRSREEYDRGHIPNAISLPLTDLSTQNPDLPHDAEIITYCT
ncbi:MAG: rhodanese-like domain-containing protein [Anaerolineae bacterium]